MFKGNLRLSRLIFRLDLFRASIWLVVILFLVVGYGAAVEGMYSSEEERVIMGEMMKNPAMVVMVGPVYDFGGYTVGALFSNFMVLWTAALVGVMNIFLVVRHTRQDEEKGRFEVIRSLPVGRLAGLSATFTVSATINIIIAIFSGLGLTALGIESIDFNGSMLFGVVLGVTGFFFATITAIFCQLCGNPRTAQSFSFGFLIAAYMLRAIGDIQNEILSLISPLGLILRSKIYTENDWIYVLILFFVSLVFLIISFWLCAERDMGAGLIPPKPGKKDASPFLKNPFTLAFKLLRTSIFVWLIIVPLIAIAYGSIMGDMESFISTNEFFKLLFPDGDPEHFISFMMVLMSILGTIPVLQFIIKARSQESGGFTENVLSRSVSRTNNLFAYFIISVIFCVLLPLLNAFGFWLGCFMSMDNPIPFITLFKSAVVFIPAIWFLIGFSVLLIGFFPKFTFLVWTYLTYTFFVIYAGELLKMPDWAKNISPFEHIPNLPKEEMEIIPLLVLTATAAIMTVFGFIGYRNRDLC